MRNLTNAVRQLTRRPGLPAVIVAILAIGIGVTTGIFSLFHQLLLKPLPVPEPDRLVNLVPTPIPVFSYPMFRDLEARQDVLTGLAGFDIIDSNLSYETRIREGEAMTVSGQYFEILGLQAALGRLIGPQDEPALAESRVAVLSHAYWQRDLGGDPSIVGRSLTINGQVLTIVGVAPAGFSGIALGAHPEAFVPLTLEYLLRNLPSDVAQDQAQDRGGFSLLAFGRLRPGIELEQAEAALDALHGAIVDEAEAALDAQFSIPGRTIVLEPGALGLRDELTGPLERPMAILLGVAFIVLLVVCANAASLLTARGAGRANEMTIRAAIGAERRQLVAQLLTEALVLAIVGAALSVLVAFLTLTGVALFVPEYLADSFSPNLSAPALLFTAATSLATVLLFGVAPAVQTSRAGARLVASSPQSSATRGATRFRSALATAQIAFSMVLLVVAGLLSQSLANIARVNLGIDVDSLITFHIAPRRNGYDAQRVAASYARVEETLAAQPGVTSVASAAIPLLTRSGLNRMVEIPGAAAEVNLQARVNYMSPRLFATTGVPLLAGRDFADSDTSSSPQVAIVNESFVREFNLGNEAIGRRLRVIGDEGDREIVGIVADAADSGGGVKLPISAHFYQPLSQFDPLLRLPQRAFYVRTAGSPDALVRSVRQIVAGVDPNLPVSELRTMEQQFERDIYEDRLVTVLSASFAALAALLTALGLYGLLSYAVTQRTRELGLRLALGAAPERLRSMVMRHVGVMVAVGCGAGVLAAIAAVRVVEAILFGVSRYEPLAFVAAVVALCVVALAAGYLPARRASRIAPMAALRYE